MPSVLPRSSAPMSSPRLHSPRRMDASAAGTRRTSASISDMVCSAAAIVLPVGAFTTITPARVAASRSILSTPMLATPITARRGEPARSTSASTVVCERTTSASYPPPSVRTWSSSPGGRFRRTSVSWPCPRASMPAGATGSTIRMRAMGDVSLAGQLASSGSETPMDPPRMMQTRADVRRRGTPAHRGDRRVLWDLLRPQQLILVAVRDGRIARFREYFDSTTLIEAVSSASA